VQYGLKRLSYDTIRELAVVPDSERSAPLMARSENDPGPLPFIYHLHNLYTANDPL
jgi:hypothetical protein